MIVGPLPEPEPEVDGNDAALQVGDAPDSVYGPGGPLCLSLSPNKIRESCVLDVWLDPCLILRWLKLEAPRLMTLLR